MIDYEGSDIDIFAAMAGVADGGILAAALLFLWAAESSSGDSRNQQPAQTRSGWEALISAPDAPATQPADSGNSLTVGTPDPVVEATPELLAKWFNQLDDADPAIRDDGYNKLMSLKSTDLDTLKAVVKKSLPLRPAQVSLLPGIVKQVYLSGMDYDGDVAEGFMGVSLIDRDNPQFPQAAPAVGERHVGIMIGHCMPGFGGARSLRDGDVVLSVAESPDAKLDSTAALAETVVKFGAGAVIHLNVLRHGQVIRVPVTLDARPIELDNVPNGLMVIQDLSARRDTAADKYWNEDFSLIFKPVAS